MPDSAVNKFLKNELLGIKQSLLNIFVTPLKRFINEQNFSAEELTANKFPSEFAITKEISEKANVLPEKIQLTRSYEENNGRHTGKTEIEIDRGNLLKEESFVGTYAHELGHAKYTKLHSHLNLSYLNIPYKLLLSATSNMYGLGLSAYAAMGGNKVLDGANWLSSHTGKYLLAGIAVNAVLIRTREHMADLFAYNQTGLLPSQYNGDEKRAGIIGNVSKLLGDTYGLIGSGYPSYIERDAICKFLGNKPKDVSFVEKLKAERQQQKSMSPDL